MGAMGNSLRILSPMFDLPVFINMGGRPSRLRVDLASLDGQCQQRRTCQRGHDVKASKRERLRTLAKMHAQNRYALTWLDRKSTRLNSSHVKISYAVFCLKKNKD